MSKKKTPNKSIPKKTAIDSIAFNKLKVSLGIIISTFAFFLYINSINHDFTLDDHPVIDENKITTQGIAGIPELLKTDYWYGYKEELRGPIYRPTSLIVFAVLWQFFPNTPSIYHLVNVLTYAVTCLMLFLVLCQLFKNYSLLYPFICTLLYAAHPIHTEVVNNVKSMDEMLCLLFGITSIYFLFKHLKDKSISALVLGGLGFFLSLISKETGIAFLAIIPLTLFFFSDATSKKNMATFGILVAITAFYLMLRVVILKDVHQSNATVNVLNNTLNAAPDIISRYATVFYILLRYVILLLFPLQLTCDYNYAQISIRSLNDPLALLGVLLFCGLGVLSILNFRKYNFLVYAFWFFTIALAPVSNFFFLNGATMAERFLYIPSLGFCIFLTYILIHYTKSEKIKNNFKTLSEFFSMNTILFSIAFGIIFLYSVKTITRNFNWKDNITIFNHDVKISDKSATAHKILGSSLFYEAQDSPNAQDKADTFQIAKSHLKKSLEIFPNYIGPAGTLGIIYYLENNFDSAYYYQKMELASQKDDLELNYSFGKTLNKLLRYDEAIQVSNYVISKNPKHEGANYNLALAYTNKGDTEKGLYYFSKVIELNPNRGDAFYYSGMILRAKGEEEKANEYFNRANALGFKQ